MTFAICDRTCWLAKALLSLCIESEHSVFPLLSLLQQDMAVSTLNDTLCLIMLHPCLSKGWVLVKHNCISSIVQRKLL